MSVSLPPIQHPLFISNTQNMTQPWVRFFYDMWQNMIAVTSYAEIFCVTTDVALTDQDTWYQVTNMQVGHADMISADESNIKIGTGDHEVKAFMSISLAAPGGGQTLRFAFGVDEVVDTDHQISRDVSTADIGAVALGGIVDNETSNANIALFALNNTSAGKTITFDRATMIVNKMHAGD